MRGRIRPFKVSELIAQQDERLLRKGTVLTDIVANCWLETLDRGPYSFNTSERPPWPVLLHADKMHALRCIRTLTTGSPDFEYQVQCLDETCKHQFAWVVDLMKLEMLPLRAKSIPHLREGVPLTVDVAGTTVEFRLLRNEDDARLMEYINKHGYSSFIAAFLCRIVAVKGVETDMHALAAWLENLDLADIDDLETAMDEHEAGLLLQTDITCPRCNTAWRSMIPLVQAVTRSSMRKARTLLRAKTSGANSSASPGTSGKPEDPTLPSTPS